MEAKEPTPNSANYSYEGEEEETLSLCDLPIYSKSDSWDEYDDDFSASSKKYQSSASNDDDEEEDFFEFFSEDFTAATIPINKEIIFCGKLMTLAGQDQQKPTQDQNPKTSEKSLPEKPRRRRKQSIFQHLLKSPPPSNDSKALASYDNEVRVSKTSSTMGSPAVKSRWFLFMFGMMRVPTEMKLRDMRTRQSLSRRRRSHSATMFPSFEEGREETTAEKVSYKRRGKGFWGMLRALGCRSRHPEVVAKAAYGCSPIPRE